MQIVGLANTNVSSAANFEETQKACPGMNSRKTTDTIATIFLQKTSDSG
jgi:hypothetical protein